MASNSDQVLQLPLPQTGASTQRIMSLNGLAMGDAAYDKLIETTSNISTHAAPVILFKQDCGLESAKGCHERQNNLAHIKYTMHLHQE